MEYGVPFWFIVLALTLICFFVTSAAVHCRHLVSNTALVHLRRSLAVALCFSLPSYFNPLQPRHTVFYVSFSLPCSFHCSCCY